VTESAARAIAKSAHDGQQTSTGRSQFDHVRRVAAAVPNRARVTAWLHDILERTGLTIEQLRAQGMSRAELSALALLTRTEEGDYRAYVQRIADAPGQGGAVARVVKLADLEDHLVDPVAGSPSTPPYAWARRAILLAYADASVSAANVDYVISNVCRCDAREAQLPLAPHDRAAVWTRRRGLPHAR
jgi:hypothetical protein